MLETGICLMVTPSEATKKPQANSSETLQDAGCVFPKQAKFYNHTAKLTVQ